MDRAFARRIDEELVERPEGIDAVLEEIEHLELRDQVVREGVLPRPLDELPAAFEADHLRAAARERQGEVAQAAEKIGDAFASLRSKQAYRARNQRTVYR